MADLKSAAHASSGMPDDADLKSDANEPKKASFTKIGYVVPFLAFICYIQATCFASSLSSMVGFRINPSFWCEHFLSILRTRYFHTKKSRKVADDKNGPVIFLCNHRSWGDFWAEHATLGGPSFLSRWMVAVALPASGLYGWLDGWLWFFSRGKKHAEGQIQWFVNFYRSSHQKRPVKGLVMYPEGTRSTKPESLPLKVGGLIVAHRLQWPVQVVITTNKEHIMAEKKLSLGIGVPCVTSVSEVIDPKNFEDADEFVEAVKTTWASTWEDAYSASPSELQEREGALLPGAMRSQNKYALTGSMRINGLRAMVLLAAALRVASATRTGGSKS